MIYKQKRKISFYDLDANGNTKLTALLKYMNEASWLNAEELGAGLDRTLEVGLAFIIQRIGVRIFKMPELNQTIAIRTWPAEKTRSAFKRNGDICDEAGNKIMEWESLWVLIDINKRKIKRPSASPAELPRYGKMDVEVVADKIVIPEERNLYASYKHIVSFSELDINMHMNNAIYGDLVANVLAPTDAANIRAWKEVQFNYVHEAKLGDEVAVNAYQANGNLYITGNSEEKRIFTVAIKGEDQNVLFKL